MAAICGCAVLGSGFGNLEPAWTEEVDLAKAKVYVSENATCPEVEAAKLFLRAQIMVAGGRDTTNVTSPSVRTS